MVLYTQPATRPPSTSTTSACTCRWSAKLPGLLRAETGKFTMALDGGEQTYYRVAELYFADQDAMNAAFGSPEGAATAADYGADRPARLADARRGTRRLTTSQADGCFARVRSA